MRSKHVGCTQVGGLSSFWGVGMCQALDRNWDPTGTTTLALGVYWPHLSLLRCRMKNTNYYQDLFSQRKFCSLEGIRGMPCRLCRLDFSPACLHTASKSAHLQIEYKSSLNLWVLQHSRALYCYSSGRSSSSTGKKLHTQKFSPKAFFACEVDSAMHGFFAPLFFRKVIEASLHSSAALCAMQRCYKRFFYLPCIHCEL